MTKKTTTRKKKGASDERREMERKAETDAAYKETGLSTIEPAPLAMEGRGPRDLLANLDLAGMREVAQWFAKTTMVPKVFHNKPDDLVVCWCFGAELGITPLQSMTSIAVVNGNPTVWGVAVPALVRNAPGFVKLEEDNNFEDCDSLKEAWAECTIIRKNASGATETHRKRYSYKMAMTAGLTGKDNWKNHPGMMLENRARNWTSRVAFPEVLRGMPVREEVAEEMRTADVRLIDGEPPSTKGSDALGDKLGERREATTPADPSDGTSDPSSAPGEVERDLETIAFVFYGHARPEQTPADFKPWAVWVDPKAQPGALQQVHRFEPKEGLTAELLASEIEFDYWEWANFVLSPDQAEFVRERITKDVREAALDANISSKHLLGWCNLESKATKDDRAKDAAGVRVQILARAYWAIVDGTLGGGQ